MLGWLCIVQSLWAYTPGVRAGLSVGLPPRTKQGCLQSVAHSRCTMRWHKWLTTCTGATPLRPRFYIIKRFIDSLKQTSVNADARFYIQFNRLPLRLNRKLLAPRTVLLSISVGLIRPDPELVACVRLQALYRIACRSSLSASVNSHPFTALVLL